MTYCKANNAEIADSFAHSRVTKTSGMQYHGMRYLEGAFKLLAARQGCVATWSAIRIGDGRLVVEVEEKEAM
jgi:hypothetical protein